MCFTITLDILLVTEFVLGFAIGYLSAKVFKYMLALMGILAFSTMANLWAVSGVPDKVVKELESNITVIVSTSKKILSVLSLAVLSGVGAVAIGFVIGAIYGFLKGK